MGRPFDFTQSIIAAARMRQDGRCACCGIELSDRVEEAHHVIPNQSGNPADPTHGWLRSVENCVVICDLCHGRVHEDSRFKKGAVAPPEYYPYSHAVKNSAAHRQWASQLNGWADKLFAPQLKAYNELKSKLEWLRRAYERDYQDHKTQLGLYNSSFAGYVTNRLFNGEPPQLAIWNNAYSYLLHAERELSDGNIDPIHHSLATFAYAGATKFYFHWKSGIEIAGSKAQYAIAAAAAVAIIAFVAPTVIAATWEVGVAEAAANPQEVSGRIVSAADRLRVVIDSADPVREAGRLLDIEQFEETHHLQEQAKKMLRR